MWHLSAHSGDTLRRRQCSCFDDFLRAAKFLQKVVTVQMHKELYEQLYPL